MRKTVMIDTNAVAIISLLPPSEDDFVSRDFPDFFSGFDAEPDTVGATAGMEAKSPAPKNEIFVALAKMHLNYLSELTKYGSKTNKKLYIIIIIRRLIKKLF